MSILLFILYIENYFVPKRKICAIFRYFILISGLNQANFTFVSKKIT